MAARKAARKPRGTNGAPEKRRWEDRFLRVFAECGIVCAACKAAGIGRTTVYRRRDESPAFAERWKTAELEAVEGLEEVAVDRARKGSDLLLIFLLKARKPAMYRERVTVQNDGPTGLQAFDRVVLVASDGTNGDSDSSDSDQGDGEAEGPAPTEPVED